MRVHSGFLVLAVVLTLTAPAQANIAVEFAGTIDPLDFSAGVASDTPTMSVVRAFFDDAALSRGRDLAKFSCYGERRSRSVGSLTTP